MNDLTPSPLTPYGWNDTLEAELTALGLSQVCPGRIVSQQRGLVKVVTEYGVLQSDAAGRLLHDVAQEHRPVIGDWVVCEPRIAEQSATIVAMLPRQSCFMRKQAGKRVQAQSVAANIDIAFLVMTLGADFNASRLERYLTLTRESGATPVIVLTKSDLCDDIPAMLEVVAEQAPGVQTLVVSSRLGIGLDQVAAVLKTGQTGVLLGSSGAGKSTLLNALLERDHARTGRVSAHEEKGRHTTSHRELVQLPAGGLLIDTPGMRELGMVSTVESLSAALEEIGGQIEELSSQCRFRDCRHEGEPGCAVRAALEDGTLAAQTWQTWKQLTDEIAELEHQATLYSRTDARRARVASGRLTRKDHQRGVPNRKKRP